MSLTTSEEAGRWIVTVAGEVDMETVPRLRDQLIDLLQHGHHHLIVDLENVEFLDSTGLGVLVGALQRVRAHNGSLRLICTSERILKVFHVTGLAKVFPIHDSLAAAHTAVDPPP